MLYLISKPFDLMAGNYSCKQIDAELSKTLIKNAYDAGELQSMVHFASTVAALKKLASVDIQPGERGGGELPSLKHGDSILAVRLQSTTEKGRPISLDDLEFWLVSFSQDAYQQIKDSAEWPAVMR
jgi:hypothetical protein